MKKALLLLPLSLFASTLVFSAPRAHPLLSQKDQFYSLDENEEKKPASPAKINAAAKKPEEVPEEVDAQQLAQMRKQREQEEQILVRFVDIDIIELLKFVSGLANKNFIFDPDELNFTVTVVSDEPTSVDNIMTALMQELRIHGVKIIEKDNNIILHRNPDVNAISQVESGAPGDREKAGEIVTQVFTLNTLAPEKAAALIRPLTSTAAIIEPSTTTQHLIITDLESNVREIAKLIEEIDAPAGGLRIGQYVVQSAAIDNLVTLTEEIMLPIAQGQPISFVKHNTARSVFVVSSPFLVEKALSVMQNLDQLEGSTRIMNLQDMKFEPGKFQIAPKTPSLEGLPGTSVEQGRWELDPLGRWIFKPANAPTEEEIRRGRWRIDPDEYWYFDPNGGPSDGRSPRGQWIKNANGEYQFELNPGETISARKVQREQKVTPDLPVGHIDRTKFYLKKLNYRQGDQILDALQNIGQSLDTNNRGNLDLITTLDTVQWIEASNSIVFTGTDDSIGKVKELIEEIDTPLRQVFIEMLILETDIDDSLNYGVNFGSRFGGGDTSGAQAFLSGASPLATALDTAGIGGLPDANTLARTQGYNLGIIGRNLTKNGTIFQSLGALVKALHTDTRTNIILNPKILTEDNATAEIFVGINTQFRTDSIANDEGSIITSNFEFRDVGTTLKVTPLLGNNNIITLDIEQEVSNVAQNQGAEETPLSQNSAGPTTRINRTNTRVHIPDQYFLVLSGMIQRQKTVTTTQVPCLGGLPILGGLFKDKDNTDEKRNLMIFIRPQIIDTEEQIQELTKRQQDIYNHKNRTRSLWKYEVDEALDLLNIKEPDCGTECR